MTFINAMHVRQRLEIVDVLLTDGQNIVTFFFIVFKGVPLKAMKMHCMFHAGSMILTFFFD